MDPVVWLDNNRTNAGSAARSSAREITSARSLRGTTVATILYSLVESARASGVDPISYLIEVAMRAQQSPGSVLLPEDFGQERQAAA